MATPLVAKKPIGGGNSLTTSASTWLTRIEVIAKGVAGLVDTGEAIWTVWQLAVRPEQIDQAINRWNDALRHLTAAKELNSASRGWVSHNWTGGAHDAFIGHMNTNAKVTDVTMQKLKDIGDSLVDAGFKATVDYYWALKQVVAAGSELYKNGVTELNVRTDETKKQTAVQVILDAAKRITDRVAALETAMADQKARMQKMGFTAAQIERPNSIPVGSTRRAGWDPRVSAKFSDIKAAGDKLLESSGEWGKAADCAWWAGQLPDNSLGRAGTDIVHIYTRLATGVARELATGCEKLGNSATSLWVVSKNYKNAEEEHADWVRLVWQAHDKVMTWRGHDPRNSQWSDADPWW